MTLEPETLESRLRAVKTSIIAQNPVKVELLNRHIGSADDVINKP